MLPCSRELLVRLWLDMDVSIPLFFLLWVVWSGRSSEAESLNTDVWVPLFKVSTVAGERI